MHVLFSEIYKHRSFQVVHMGHKCLNELPVEVNSVIKYKGVLNCCCCVVGHECPRWEVRGWEGPKWSSENSGRSAGMSIPRPTICFPTLYNHTGPNKLYSSSLIENLQLSELIRVLVQLLHSSAEWTGPNFHLLQKLFWLMNQFSLIFFCLLSWFWYVLLELYTPHQIQSFEF